MKKDEMQEPKIEEKTQENEDPEKHEVDEKGMLMGDKKSDQTALEIDNFDEIQLKPQPQISSTAVDVGKHRHNKKCNPGVIGLAAFGLTTILLQFHNIGLSHSINPIIWTGLVFGGVAQLAAGFQEFSTGNNFGYCAFTGYGSFWIAFAFIEVGKKYHFEVTQSELGYFMIMWTLFTFFMCIGSAGVSLALFLTFFFLFFGFVALDIALFSEGDVHKNAAKCAGYILLVCAVGAWYCWLHILYNDVFTRDIIPVGPSPVAIIRAFCDKRKGKKVQ